MTDLQTAPEALEPTAEELGAKLNPKYKHFADAYTRLMNRRRAAIEAGYAEGAADEAGWRLYRRPDVRAYLEAVFREGRMGPEEVMRRLLEYATLDLSEITKVERVLDGQGNVLRTLLLVDADLIKEKGYDRFLKSVGFDSNGNPKYEFIDPQAALRDLGRAHKLFGDANTLSGPNGGAVPVSMEVVFRRPGEGQQPSVSDGNTDIGNPPTEGQQLLERIETASSEREERSGRRPLSRPASDEM